jgi:hypothetical protein
MFYLAGMFAELTTVYIKSLYYGISTSYTYCFILGHSRPRAALLTQHEMHLRIEK